MGRTEQRLLVAGLIAFLLAVSAATGAAATDARAATLERVSSASPTAFAERITAGDAHSAASRDSWQTAIELIVLIATCAIAVAFYSAATAQRTDLQPVPVRIRRR